VDVDFTRNLARLEDLAGLVQGMGIEIRCCVVSPRGEVGAVNAHLRLATIDGPAVRRALRERGFVISSPTSSL
jgi:hypothetical protein